MAYLLGGILLCGLGSGLYIGANLGPGPRDGLMTGLAARGHSIRVVETDYDSLGVDTPEDFERVCKLFELSCHFHG